jgi:hypothetical protein
VVKSDHKWRHNMAHRGACWIKKATRSRPQARAHTHVENIKYILLFHGKNDSRTRPSVSLQYIACLVT